MLREREREKEEKYVQFLLDNQLPRAHDAPLPLDHQEIIGPGGGSHLIEAGPELGRARLSVPVPVLVPPDPRQHLQALVEAAGVVVADEGADGEACWEGCGDLRRDEGVWE